MTAKKRVYDLAKEYGMTGQALAAKLRDIGFVQVKSHMTALSETEVLEVQARLEAYGIVGEAGAQTAPETMGGLKIKRRKKKKPAPAEEEAPAQPEPAPEKSAAAEGEPAAPEAAPPAPEAETEPSSKETAAPEAVEPEPEKPAPVAGTAEPEPEPEPTPEPEPEDAEAEAEPAPEPEAPAEPDTEEQETPAPTAASASAETAETKETEEGSSEEEAAPEVVRPSSQRRTGKVVGFIDPSKFERKAPPKSQSRRLRSSDDVMPNVMPTFGRSRHSGQVRGDQTRGSMTAQELREREAGRFLRRRRIQQSGPGSRGGRRSGSRSTTSAGSPYAGQSVQINAPVTIKKLANTLAVKENQVFRVAMREIGFGITINTTIDEETAVLLASEFDVDLVVVQEVAAEEQLLAELEKEREAIADEKLVQRAPCVAFLGHVDHGKTTLIDTIRSSRIANKEAGGITQHIGAYQVSTKGGHTLTIVDTPGHAAFTAMRARGAHAVDIVVLVVAADDGVKPQTEEAINHAKAAGTPIVVAMNKMDKPDANPERVRNELAALGLTPEEWGGETAMLEVSGLKGDGVDELLERVFLESEVLELRSHPDGPASGIVLEAEIEKGKGKVAHLLIQDGSLKRGDVILAGKGYGKVRSIHDDRGKQIKEAGPSMPVEVTGLNELPTIGDRFVVVPAGLDRASEVATERARAERMAMMAENRPKLQRDILEAVAEADKTQLNFILKGDTQGSVEVLKQQIESFEHDEMQVKLVHSGVGAVLESDVDLAMNSNSRILAFQTSADAKVRQAAERNGVEIKVYSVIYELLDDIRAAMEGSLAPEIKEEIQGHAEIRRIFKSSKIGNIAGCYVLDGKVTRSSKARLLRDGQVVWTGEIGTLRRESDDAKEVREGFECGIVLSNFNDIRLEDVIEAYRLVEVKRTL
ncbi:MAG TPA: translation initiation factor IF-2 [Planctomycetes bacterium]|nr:translation initiation factor IF-2 [Planctomycetota bacterium]